MTTTTVVLALLLVAASASAALLAASRARLARRASRREADLREQLAGARAAARSDEQALHAFRSAATEAMAEQSRQLLHLADAKYETLEQSAEARWTSQAKTVLGRLDTFAEHLRQLEIERRDDSGSLRGAVDALREHTAAVQVEAGNLAAALRDNSTRGLWGEVQLRRALESAGMTAHADFHEQATVRSEDGAQRPDVVVHLPNDRVVVIDAKAPLDAFLRAADADDPEERARRIAEHGAAVHRHTEGLSKRRYDQVVGGSVDFVVLFLPGDPYLAAAVEGRPSIFEEAWSKGVLLVTPTTLIGLLRAVAMGWRERQVTEQAEQIAELGRELHRRVSTFARHYQAVGASLGKAVGAYNESMGSMERRLLVTARRFEDLGAGSGQELPPPGAIEAMPQHAGAEELQGPHSAA